MSAAPRAIHAGEAGRTGVLETRNDSTASATASPANIAQLNGLPESHARTATESNGATSSHHAVRTGGRQPPTSNTASVANQTCQATASHRQSLAIAASPLRIVSGDGISLRSSLTLQGATSMP